MNIRSYWAKIVLKALGIFCVGYIGLSLFRSGKQEVRRAVHSNADLTIPLPFVPFNFDGTRLGTFRRIVFHRSTPDHVESVDVTVRLSDSGLVQQLSGCSHLTVDDPSRIDENTSFRCGVLDDANIEFGAVRVYARGADGWREATEIPLVLPKEVAQKIRGETAQMNASQLESARMKQLGDSMGVLARQFAEATTADARRDAKLAMETLEREMEALRNSIVESAVERAQAAITIRTGKGAEITITPDAPEAPEAPAAPAPPR